MEIEETLSAFISREILEEELNKIHEAEELLASGLVDSMGMMRIVRFAEKAFNIEIPFEDMTLENFMTIKNLSSYILKKLE